jgi:hypothetical protein
VRGDALAPTGRPHLVTHLARKITNHAITKKKHEERPANGLSFFFFLFRKGKKRRSQ